MRECTPHVPEREKRSAPYNRENAPPDAEQTGMEIVKEKREDKSGENNLPRDTEPQEKHRTLEPAKRGIGHKKYLEEITVEK